MKVLVIDAQGGGIGKQIVSAIRTEGIPAEITAVGANMAATAQMMKADPDHSATGENPVVVACRTADAIIGPIGIAIADSMYGEITPAMALAVGQSTATKILIPINNCSNYVAGVDNLNMKYLISAAVEKLKSLT